MLNKLLDLEKLFKFKMIKLKDILLESTAPDIFIPRRLGDRVERYIKQYIRNGSKGDLNLSDMNLVELPAILSNVTVSGDFDCGGNKLKSLSGAPQHVGGHFNCSLNLLTSLSGAPQHVGGYFDCYGNKLTSLNGAPQHLDGTFSCSYNKLKSLSGAPQHVGGHFYCYSNSLTSLSGAPQHVVGDFYCTNNAVKFTVAQVRAVCDVSGEVFV